MEKTLMKGELSCALCNAEPQVHCESDEAFLCYTCDTLVHRANFLVARHTRAILCHKCKTPTQVHASGPGVDSAVISACNECAHSISAGDIEQSVSGSHSDSGLDLNSSPEEEEEEEEDDDDIHVVPESVGDVLTGWKRSRFSNGLDDQEDTTCCSTSDPSCAESQSSDDDATSLSSDFNPRAHKRAFFLN